MVNNLNEVETVIFVNKISFSSENSFLIFFIFNDWFLLFSFLELLKYIQQKNFFFRFLPKCLQTDNLNN